MTRGGLRSTQPPKWRSARGRRAGGHRHRNAVGLHRSGDPASSADAIRVLTQGDSVEGHSGGAPEASAAARIRGTPALAEVISRYTTMFPDVIEGIRLVARGKSLIDPSVAGKLLARLRAPTPAPEKDPLSRREREILELITDGLTNRQIGERLFLAEKTVKNYVSALLAKLGIQRRTQAAAYGAVRRMTHPRSTIRRRWKPTSSTQKLSRPPARTMPSDRPDHSHQPTTAAVGSQKPRSCT